MKAGKIGKKEIQIIHVAKNQLMMNKEEYQDFLSTFGVSTSKDLSYLQYDGLMQKFRAAGFVFTSKQKPTGALPKLPWDKQPMMKKIEALLGAMKLPWKYADAIARRMYKIDHTAWCTPPQLHSIVAALEYKKKKFALEGNQ